MKSDEVLFAIVSLERLKSVFEFLRYAIELRPYAARRLKKEVHSTCTQGGEALTHK